MNEKNYLALLHKIGLNQKKLSIIFDNNNNYKDFYNNLSQKILISYGFTPKQIYFILENKVKYNIANINSSLSNRKVKIVTMNEEGYPEYLNEIANSPFLFYLRGSIDNSPKISIVGSRKITGYGENIINKLIGDISKYFVIVSGGAAGCDTLAHKIALNNGNKTISIIGTGIDKDYPTSNKSLYDNIVDNGGGVISIFPLGENGNPYNFPVRNELVAGLSKGVVVIEAKIKSGTLITSNLALDLGKDLFAVPGDIYKGSSEGCNMLIKKGMAKLVTCSQDILDEYNIGYTKNKGVIKKEIKFSDDFEKEIYNLLLLESLSINELISKTSLDITTLSFKLSMMEINNLVKNTIGGKYEVF